MRKYVIVNNESGNINQIMGWGDDRDFPSNIQIGLNETLVVVDSQESIDLYNTYDFVSGQFYVLDIDDTTLELSILRTELNNYNSILSDFQESIYTAMGIDITKLPLEWLEKIQYKTRLRERIAELEAM